MSATTVISASAVKLYQRLWVPDPQGDAISIAWIWALLESADSANGSSAMAMPGGSSLFARAAIVGVNDRMAAVADADTVGSSEGDGVATASSLSSLWDAPAASTRPMSSNPMSAAATSS